MNHLTRILILWAGLPSAIAMAQTSFTPESGNFNDPANWSAGLPDTVAAADGDDHGIIPFGTSATMSALYQSLTGRRIRLTVEGTLDIGSQELQLRSGSFGTSSPVRGSYGDLDVNGGTVTVGSGGQIDMAGVGSDLIIDQGGSVTFATGSIMSGPKAIHILNGSIGFAATMTRAASVEDELIVGAGSTLKFEIDNDPGGTVLSPIPGSSLQLELAPTSKLALEFTNPPALGETFTVVTGVSGYKLVGGSGTGKFGMVTATGLPAGLSASANYLPTSLEVEIIETPPSPLLVAAETASFTNSGASQFYSVPLSNESGDNATPLAVTGVTVSGPDASAVSDIVWTQSIDAGTVGFLDFVFTPGTTAGFYTFDFAVASNDASAASPRTLAVTVEVKDPFITLDGDTLRDLGSFAHASGPQTTAITVFNSGSGLDLVIDPVTTALSGNSAFAITSVPGPIAPGGSGEIEVTFTPGTATGLFASTLAIGSNDYTGATPTVRLSAIALPPAPYAAFDFGRDTTPVAEGFVQVPVAEGVVAQASGVTISLSSKDGDIIAGASAGGKFPLEIDYARTTFNGGEGNSISVRIAGLKTGTLDLFSHHDYASSLDLPIDVLFGEEGGTLALLADDLLRTNSVHHSTAVEAGKTYELRILEQGSANVAYLAGLVLSGSAMGDGTASPYSQWAAANGLSGAPDADDDQDGVPDAVEYVTGSDPNSGANASPMTVATAGGNVIFTFQRDDASETPGTTVDVQLGPDLAGWPVTLAVGADTASSSPTVEVIENGTEPDTIHVTRPMAGGERFARLVVAVAP